MTFPKTHGSTVIITDFSFANHDSLMLVSEMFSFEFFFSIFREDTRLGYYVFSNQKSTRKTFLTPNKDQWQNKIKCNFKTLKHFEIHLLDFSTPFFHWSVSFKVYLPAIIIAYFSIQLRAQSIIKKNQPSSVPQVTFVANLLSTRVNFNFPLHALIVYELRPSAATWPGMATKKWECWENDWGKRACSLRVVKLQRKSSKDDLPLAAEGDGYIHLDKTHNRFLRFVAVTELGCFFKMKRNSPQEKRQRNLMFKKRILLFLRRATKKTNLTWSSIWLRTYQQNQLKSFKKKLVRIGWDGRYRWWQLMERCRMEMKITKKSKVLKKRNERFAKTKTKIVIISNFTF